MIDEDKLIKAEVYGELINDMQAKIMRYSENHPECIDDRLEEINSELSTARMESRIFPDDEHFEKWESLLAAAEIAMLENRIFRQKNS